MALTPERIRELQGYSSGGATAQPAVLTAPRQSAPQGKMGTFSQGIEDQAKTIRNIPVLKQGFDFAAGIGNAGAKLVPGFAGATLNLVSDFASKHLGDNSGITGFLSNQAKNVDYYNQGYNQQGQLAEANKTGSGKAGNVVGTVAPYLYTAGLGLPGMIAADAAIGTGQTGNFTEGAKTGLVSAATGLVSPIAKGIRSMSKGNNAIAPITKTKAVASLAGNIAKGSGRGYVADVASGLAGQRGEDRTGAKALIPGAGTALGTAIGTTQAFSPLKADLKKVDLQDVKKNINLEAGIALQGKPKQAPKVNAAIGNEFTLDEIRNSPKAKDISNLSKSKMSEIEAIKRDALAKNNATKKFEDLTVSEKVDIGGGKTKDVSTNYVKTGLKQLRDYFQKTDPKKIAIVDEYINKANSNGLSALDVEDIAVLHGREISNAAFKADGTLSTGVTKEAVNNVRNGLKSTSRSMSQDPEALKQLDSRISNLKVVQELSDKLDESVYNFEKNSYKWQSSDSLREFGKNLAYGAKFAATKAITGLIGNKNSKLTPVEIEKRLNKTLIDIKTVLNSGKSEAEALNALKGIASKIESPKLKSDMSMQEGKVSKKALLGAAAAGSAAALLLGNKKAAADDKKPSPLLKAATEKFPQPADAEKRKSGFVHSENRGAAAQGKDLYKEIGVTGDIGKYQANPQTVREWSKAWLGKAYTPEQFKNDPKAQEKFMKEFLAMAENYKLTPEESAVVWHKGWGKLGDGKTRADKERALREHIAKNMKDGSVMKYINNFKIGYGK